MRFARSSHSLAVTAVLAAALKGKEADETGAVDEIEDIAPGAAERLTLHLEPGHYALICNLPGHYFHDGKPGMLADVTVA
jgi:uncharacterized cupredoxin-like copper-binding protein